MFRIDYALQKFADRPNMWAWSVKVPSGRYELLSTDETGRGLYIRRLPRSPEECPAHLIQLLGEDEFFIPENVTKDQSIDLLEKALNKLGWDEDFIVLFSTFKAKPRNKRNVC
jgi:hypothetical protein